MSALTQDRVQCWKGGIEKVQGTRNRADNRSPGHPSASEIISSSRRRTPNQRSLSGIGRLFSSSKKHRHSQYRPTHNKIDNGPACRIYGSVKVKKVTANLHVTTLGHGYMSYEHTDHTLMNLSHVFHEFSFGPFFPAIAQPLDITYEQTEHRTSRSGQCSRQHSPYFNIFYG